jgi:hypothetical protein
MVWLMAFVMEFHLVLLMAYEWASGSGFEMVSHSELRLVCRLVYVLEFVMEFVMV